MWHCVVVVSVWFSEWYRNLLSYLQFHFRITEGAGLFSFLSCIISLQLIYLLSIDIAAYVLKKYIWFFITEYWDILLATADSQFLRLKVDSYVD